MRRGSSTRDSHLLLLLAQRRSQAALVALRRALLDGVFGAGGGGGVGRDVGDRGFLLEVAGAAGLLRGEGEEAEVLAWLDGAAGRELADGLDRRAKREVGIAAVPSFVVQGRFRVGGKQEEGLFLDLFERIRRTEGEGMEMER